MRSLKPVLITAVLLLTMVNTLSAQSKKYAIKLNKIEIRNDLNTPTFTDRIDKKKNIPLKKWVVVMADYEVKFANIKMPKGSLDNGKWIDDIEVKWEFLYKPKDAPNNIQYFIRFNRSTKYTNIGEGKHSVMLFVSPVILERYFNKGATFKNDVKIRFSMKVNGLVNKEMTTLMVENRKAGKSDIAKWVPAFDSDRSKPLKNVLLRRDETPFRSMQYDMFDSIAVEER